MPDPKTLPHALRLIPKRGQNDCAIAALASYLGFDYEVVLITASKVSKTLWSAGLSGPEHLKVARRLKVKCRWTKTYEIEEATGVLWMRYHDNANLDHDVVLIEGKIFDPDYNPACLLDHDDYCRILNAKPDQLFVKVED